MSVSADHFPAKGVSPSLLLLLLVTTKYKYNNQVCPDNMLDDLYMANCDPMDRDPKKEKKKKNSVSKIHAIYIPPHRLSRSLNSRAV